MGKDMVVVKGVGEMWVNDFPETISNPFSGESVELPPKAVAVHDVIKGCEITGNYDDMRKCMTWFMQNYPKEYFILLD